MTLAAAPTAPTDARDSAGSLRAAVAAAWLRYAERNPASAARQEAAVRVLPGGNTRTVLHYAPFPLAFARGAGATLWSIDGDAYTDFLGEFTAGLYGHSNPLILDAIREALDGGISFGGVNADEPRLAALLCERFPSLERVRFTNSGTEANLMAVALAVASTARREVLVFRGGYHGGVLGFGDAPTAVTVPHDWILADYNDIEGTRALLRQHASTLAAVLVEPMLGSGGCIPGDPAFLQMLRDEATAAGAVLIFDEVMTSRLGRGGLQGALGITPDLTTLGKYLGGGMSFGAFGGRADLMRAFDPSGPGALAHAGTFNNNVLTMRAGITGLTRVLTDAALADLNARGDRLRTELADVVGRHGAAMCVSGRGSMLTIHPSALPLLAHEPNSERQSLVRELLFFDLLDAGFWTARRGMLTLCLPVTDGDCDRLVAAFDTVLGDRAELLAT